MKRTITTAIIAIAMTGSAFAENLCVKSYEMLNDLEYAQQNTEKCRDLFGENKIEESNAACRIADGFIASSKKKFEVLTPKLISASFDSTRQEEISCAKDVMKKATEKLETINFWFKIIASLQLNNGTVK